MKMGKSALVLAATTLGLMAAPVQAAFVLVDDFDGYTAGSVSGQGSWTGTDGTVVELPSASGNNVLALTGSAASKYARTTVPQIANNTTGTLFYQIRLDSEGIGNLNHSHGLSDTTSSSSFGDYEAQLISIGSSLNVRDGASATAEVQVNALAADTWYNIWLVANNSNDTFKFFIQGGDFATPTEFAGGVSDPFNFRNGTSGALTHFFLIYGNSAGGTLYVDNIHIDTTGENISNPIPEPATAATVLTMAALGATLRGRRRRP
jgi:hypothetical protein